MKLLQAHLDHQKQSYRIPWDEAADLRAIEWCWAARAIGGGFQACCGKFWFYIRGSANHIEVYANRPWQPSRR